MNDPQLTIPPLFDKAERAMKEAVAAAIAGHWRAGRPIHIWRGEQVVALFPDGTALSEPPDPEGPP